MTTATLNCFSELTSSLVPISEELRPREGFLLPRCVIMDKNEVIIVSLNKLKH